MKKSRFNPNLQLKSCRKVQNKNVILVLSPYALLTCIRRREREDKAKGKCNNSETVLIS